MQPCLSPREITVLRLLAWGHTNKEIATRLELSVKIRAALVRYAVEKDRLTGTATPQFETEGL